MYGIKVPGTTPGRWFLIVALCQLQFHRGGQKLLPTELVTRNVDMDTVVTSSSNCRGGIILVTCLGCLHSDTGEFHADISVVSFCSMTVQEVVFPNSASTPDISAVSPTYLPRRWLTVYKSVTHLSFRNLTSRFSNGRSSPGEKENKIFIWRQSTQVHTREPYAGHRGGFSSSKIMPRSC